MILINFSHPVTDDQIQQVQSLSGIRIAQVLDVAVQFDNRWPYHEQIASLLRGLPLTADDWQTRPILVNPPALNYIAVLLIAELHGRIGYFPPVMRLRQLSSAMPPAFEVAEILNLQAVREQARGTRSGDRS